MPTNTSIHRAIASDAPEIAMMVGELLTDIMDFPPAEKYVVFIGREQDDAPGGFIAPSESHALYTEGAFGIMPELYVRPVRNRG
ncbi:MAG: hypothetical protein ACOY3Z_05380 [Thermodesulfobacteriota bacterium]